MQAPPPPRSQSGEGRHARPPKPRLEPRRVLPPLIPVLFMLTIVVSSALVAAVFLPLFGAAGAGVNAFRDRLDAAGVGKVQIPRFPERSVIYAKDGSILATVYLDENRRIVKLGNVAPVARNAVIAIEDDGFYEHGALNFPSLLRAAIANLAAGEITQGGSTITQQLVKNVIIGDTSQTFARKFQEAALAIRLERKYTKDEILELYLNEVYFGNGAYGIGTASETYFRKPPGQLDLAQAALLAAQIRAPGEYDPLGHPEAATARRNLVIDRMVSLGMVSERKGDRAKARPLGLAPDAGPPEQRVEPFFVFYIRDLILNNETGEYDAFGVTRDQRIHTLYQGGLKIYTTLDPEWQRYAQEAILTKMDEKEGPDASLVSIDAKTGAIRAMLSGKDYERDQLDLVWRGRRQVGSAFKPFTLVAAFENGFPAGKVYSSSLAELQDPRLDQRLRMREQRRGRHGRQLRRPVERHPELDQRRVRAARRRRRPREHRRGRTSDGRRRPPRRRPLDHPRRRGGVDARHGHRLRDVGERRHPLRGLRGRARPAPRRNPPVPASATVRAGDRPRRRAPRDRHAPAGGRAAARAPSPTMAWAEDRSRARPGPRRTTRTCTSPATRRRSPRPCGWASPTARSR